MENNNIKISSSSSGEYNIFHGTELSINQSYKLKIVIYVMIYNLSNKQIKNNARYLINEITACKLVHSIY